MRIRESSIPKAPSGNIPCWTWGHKCPSPLRDGSLRTAYWVGSDGQEGEVLLSPRWMSGTKKVRDMQSIRDRRFDDVKNTLVAWLKKTGCHGTDLLMAHHPLRR